MIVFGYMRTERRDLNPKGLVALTEEKERQSPLSMCTHCGRAM